MLINVRRRWLPQLIRRLKRSKSHSEQEQRRVGFHQIVPEGVNKGEPFLCLLFLLTTPDPMSSASDAGYPRDRILSCPSRQSPRPPMSSLPCATQPVAADLTAWKQQASSLNCAISPNNVSPAKSFIVAYALSV
jgi:hypothetical protein